MATLVNLYNQAGAGPKTLSLNFIRHLSEELLNEPFYILIPAYQEYASLESLNKNIQFIKLPRKERLIDKVWFRLYLEFILIPKLVKKYDIKKLLAFGSFLLTPGKFLKLVLVHHPYLFDNQLLSNAPFKTRIQERLKRAAFYLTILNTSHLVVESEYVAKCLKETWGGYIDKKNIRIILNPVSRDIGKLSKIDFEANLPEKFNQIANELKILFVSRFYPHKNHTFLIDLSKALSSYSIKHQILVTVSEEISEAQSFIDDIATQNLPIKNLGEVNQPELQAFYQSSHLFIFPSKSETFGIPMIEAMAYGLPLILPNLGYAKAIASSAGNYYESNSTESCTKLIKALIKECDLYKQRSIASFNELNCFPSPSLWVKNYLDALHVASALKGKVK